MFAALEQWVAEGKLYRLDSPEFKGVTWVGGDVYVISAYSPRAAQEARRYRWTTWAHHDRFCLITRFPRAIDAFLRKLRDAISPSTFMDKDRFYTEVAKSMAAAEQQGGGLREVVSAGLVRSQELVRESWAP